MLRKLMLAGTFLALASASPAMAADITACLVTKTDTNPFFVKMKEGATAKAAELGIELKSYAGKIDGDHESQVAAIETCIADQAKGILLTASDTQAIVDSVQQARDAGILVIALDTPLQPIDAADATFATDNFKAGELIGQWRDSLPADTPDHFMVNIQPDQNRVFAVPMSEADVEHRSLSAATRGFSSSQSSPTFSSIHRMPRSTFVSASS